MLHHVEILVLKTKKLRVSSLENMQFEAHKDYITAVYFTFNLGSNATYKKLFMSAEDEKSETGRG